MNSDVDDIFKGRIKELSDGAAYGGRFMFTDFLNPTQLSYILNNERAPEFVSCFGGFDAAERVIVRFGDKNELGYEQPFPIAILHAKPVNRKFSDVLTHRDFLGAVLNLGIDRRLTGDILTDGSEGWIFTVEHIAPFIEENLVHIKHTGVVCEIVSEIPDGIFAQPVSIYLVTPSLRLDAVISRVFSLSRKETDRLFAAEKIYVNSIAAVKPARMLKEGDLVSARGFGRFKYIETAGETRKGNIKILIEKY